MASYKRRLKRKYHDLSDEALIEEIGSFLGVFSDVALDVALAEARRRGGNVQAYVEAFQIRQAQEKKRYEQAVRKLDRLEAARIGGRPQRVTIISWVLLLWGAIVCLLFVDDIMMHPRYVQTDIRLVLMTELTGGFLIAMGAAMLQGYEWARWLFIRVTPPMLLIGSYVDVDPGLTLATSVLYLPCALILLGSGASAYFVPTADEHSLGASQGMA